MQTNDTQKPQLTNALIRDLLDPSRVNLKVQEDRTRGIFIKNLTEHYVASQKEVFQYIDIGNRHRETATTKMNPDSCFGRFSGVISSLPRRVCRPS